jgi:hypothetical protein
MVRQDQYRARSAYQLLGQIDLWRLQYGRPAREPRHPAFDSGELWPPAAPDLPLNQSASTGARDIEAKPTFGSPRKGKGFSADADNHRIVWQAVEVLGAGWRQALGALCLQLDVSGADFPKTMADAEGADSWSDMAEYIARPKRSASRQRLVKYVEYRLRWIARNK